MGSEKWRLIDGRNRVTGGECLDDVVSRKVLQGVRVPTATAQNGLLAMGQDRLQLPCPSSRFGAAHRPAARPGTSRPTLLPDLA